MEMLLDSQTKQYIEELRGELQKAITAGYGYTGAPSGFSGSTVLQTENLDSTMRSITVDMSNIKMWNILSNGKASGLVQQYNRKIALGPQNNSMYVTETGIAEESDSKYVRVTEFIRFFSKTRAFSDISKEVGMVENPETLQIKDGTQELIKELERALYFGLAKFANKATGISSASISDLPQQTIEMRGIYSQMVDADQDINHYSGDMLGYGEERSCIRDMKGATLTQGVIEDMAVIAVENFGSPKTIHSYIRAISKLQQSFYNIMRTEPGLSNQTVGFTVSTVTTSAGLLKLDSSIFLMPLTTVTPSVSRNAPLTAGVGVVASAVVCPESDPEKGSHFEAGVFKYMVYLVNREGFVSAPIMVAPITVAVGDEVRLTLTGLSSEVKSIQVSRSVAGGARPYFVGNYSVRGPSDTVVDRAHLLPQCGEAFMLDTGAEVMEWKMLKPMTKLNLAKVDASTRFSLLMAGVLVMYAPRFNSLFTNLGA